MKLPIIRSELFSEGGAWQTNGEGTMLLIESVELDRNKTMSKEHIEKGKFSSTIGLKLLNFPLTNSLKVII